MGNWSNKFEQPTKKSLLTDLDDVPSTLFDQGYKALSKACGSKPQLQWLDLPWNWCYTFACPQQGLIEIAYLVPDPSALRLAVSIRSAFFEKHPLDTLPRALQSGILSGVLINHQTWCQWEIESPEILAAIKEIVDLAIDG